MIQHNAITSQVKPVEIHRTRIQVQNTLLIIAFIVGMTLLFSLYVYQASIVYTTQQQLIAQQQAYARNQRLNNEALVLYAQTQSMSEMVRRARASGYGPAQASQIKYVRIENGNPIFVDSAQVARR